MATFTDSRYLPSFAVTTTGTIPILPTFWLSQMGYSVTILPYERGFHIIDSQTEDTVYEGTQHTDKFFYISWDFLRKLQSTKRSEALVGSHELYSDVNFMLYTDMVIE